MAHQTSPALIVGLLLAGLLAGTALAASQADIKQFPPIAGDIYGQASPGVRSITVNGKPVAFDSGQNFKTYVNLKPGEKYLILKINYEQLRIVKKYLILRKSTVKKFKVFVPKEKIEQEVQASKQAKAAERQDRQKSRQQAEQKAQRSAETKQRLALAKQEQAKALRSEQEKNWLATVPAPQFFAKEFQGSFEVSSLNQAVLDDNYQIPFKTPLNSVARINELLIVTNFYELSQKKHSSRRLTQQMKRLVRETTAYRGSPFSSLSAFQRKKIGLLNRLLIEATYPTAPKRASWQTAKLSVAKPMISGLPRSKEYLYVWEFSEGKLLVAKETKGKYSAEVYIPVAKEWLDLRGLSEEGLRKLIEKPIKSYKEKKK